MSDDDNKIEMLEKQIANMQQQLNDIKLVKSEKTKVISELGDFFRPIESIIGVHSFSLAEYIYNRKKDLIAILNEDTLKGMEKVKKLVKTSYDKKTKPFKNGTLTGTVKQLFSNHPNRWFTANEVVEELPELPRYSVTSTISALSLYEDFLERKNCERPDNNALYEYRVKERKKHVYLFPKGEQLEKLVSYLNDKKIFWVTNKVVSQETGLSASYVSATMSRFYRKGKLDRLENGKIFLKHGGEANHPRYKYKLKEGVKI